MSFAFSRLNLCFNISCKVFPPISIFFFQVHKMAWVLNKNSTNISKRQRLEFFCYQGYSQLDPSLLGCHEKLLVYQLLFQFQFQHGECCGHCNQLQAVLQPQGIAQEKPCLLPFELRCKVTYWFLIWKIKNNTFLPTKANKLWLLTK